MSHARHQRYVSMSPSPLARPGLPTMNWKGAVIPLNDILRYMTDDELKAFLLKAIESNGPQADRQIEHMLQAMPLEPMACADAEEAADRVMRTDEQSQEQDWILKTLLRSAVPERHLVRSDEKIAAMLDAFDAEPLT